MPLTFAQSDDAALPLDAVTIEGFESWKEGLSKPARAWVEGTGFTGALGSVVSFCGDDGALIGAAAGLGDAKSRRRSRFALAVARAKLPEAIYRLNAGDLAQEALNEAALGWLLAGYCFDRYAKNAAPKAQMIAPIGIDAARLEAIAASEALTRDLINTPASDMGPAELEAAALNLATEFSMKAVVITGEELLERNFPMIHAVGRASSRAPRLIDMRWGKAGPRLTLVGKGVCFDTGGLNIKPGASMGLMKKDMGGAANVLGLARMIMALGLKVQLRVLIPAVENAISGDAFRPQDILTSRKGLTVEINNTDAEGRLVLADALALADEETPDLIISMATLTGAARVAVGPDLAPFFAQDLQDADALRAAGARAADPVWELPFWEPYEPMIEPGIADLDNAPAGGFGGAITAALFLRRFVEDTPRYIHFDIYGWQPAAAPGRPKGGVGQGGRAILEALPDLLGL
ncbi:MAG: leucyl aminopeptidase family protein [Paracoccaceae bacterium]